MQEVGTLTLHELGAKAHPFFKQALVPYTPGGDVKAWNNCIKDQFRKLTCSVHIRCYVSFSIFLVLVFAVILVIISNTRRQFLLLQEYHVGIIFIEF